MSILDFNRNKSNIFEYFSIDLNNNNNIPIAYIINKNSQDVASNSNFNNYVTKIKYSNVKRSKDAKIGESNYNDGCKIDGFHTYTDKYNKFIKYFYYDDNSNNINDLTKFHSLFNIKGKLHTSLFYEIIFRYKQNQINPYYWFSNKIFSILNNFK